jgi:alkanesulfonate monooxygenase SsuD/methylene tetrahydromethanopterin reductase-like flavin-dependent oxidoreductase (luciferase family)
VLSHYRPPALLAKMAATLQTFTGRFVLGLGAGWKADEYQAYGYSTRRHAHSAVGRAQISSSCGPSRRHLPTGGTTALRTPSAAAPGAGHPAAHRRQRAASRAVVAMPIGGTAAVRPQYADPAALRATAAMGRDYDSVVKTWWAIAGVAPTRAAAQIIAEASPFYNAESAIVGTPAEVVAQLRRLVDLGVAHFILRFADFPHTAGITLFGQEVISAFEA